MKIVKIEGSNPYERGLSHGRQLKEQIHEMLNISQKRKANDNTETDYLKAVGDLMMKTPAVMDPINRYTPWLLDEIKGIAEAAEVDFVSLLAFQSLHLQLVIDDLGLLKSLDSHDTDSTKASLGCTVVGGYQMDQNSTILAQNLDQTAVWDGYQVLFHIIEPENDLEIMTVAYPGFVGTLGLNNKGIGVCINSIPMYLNKELKGLPVIFLVRGLLSKSNIDEAIDFMEAQRLSSGVVCTVGDSSKIVCYECSPAKNVRFVPEKYPRYVYHTNHPLVNNDYGPLVKEKLEKLESTSLYEITTTDVGLDKIQENLTDPEWLEKELPKYEFVGHLENSRVRLKTVQKYLDRHKDTLTVDDFKEIFSSKDDDLNTVCMDCNDNPLYKILEINTNFSIIMDLSENPVFYVADGPPSRAEYKKFTF
ncbi:MAG: hypothetical protein JRH15_01860 [Deltaproteobacteria bacterium]|nr:hypothetical protein [Deltaproteobacteria bacterium]